MKKITLAVGVIGVLAVVTHDAHAGNVDQNDPCSPPVVVHNLLSLISDGDLDGAMELLDVDVTYVNVGLAKVESRAEASAFLSPLVSLFSSINLVDPATFSVMHNGKKVNVERVEHYTVSPYAPFGNPGNRFDLHVSGNFTVENCQVTRWVDYFSLEEFNTGSGFDLPADLTAVP